MDESTQIKEIRTGLIYDVDFDINNNIFMIWRTDKPNFEGKPISIEEMNYFLKSKMIEVIDNPNNIFGKII